MRQSTFEKTKWNHRFSHGGSLRNLRAGRRERPLSTREPIHLVFKANRECIGTGFRTPRRYALANAILRKYTERFFIRIAQVSFQGDHIHMVVRISRRSNFQNFLRVFGGQIAQRFGQEGLLSSAPCGPTGRTGATDTPKPPTKLWQHRPFTRVVRGARAFRTVMDYVRLNEFEAIGAIPYRKERLKGLSTGEQKKFRIGGVEPWANGWS